MRTKWEILCERRIAAKEAFDKIDREIAGLSQTPCNLKCDSCDQLLVTEADFAGHFLVEDERFLNLGWCPKGSRYQK